MKFRSIFIITAIVWTSGVTNFQPVLAKSNDSILEQAKRANEDIRYDKAIKLLDLALQQQPNLADAYLERGKAKHSLDEDKSAIKDYNLALKYKPNFAEAYLERGKAKRYPAYQSAIEDFNLALKYKPNFADAYLERGKVKSFTGKYKSAIEDLNRAINIDPKSIGAYTQRGVVYRTDLRQKERGNRDLDFALKIEPKSAKNYNDLSYVFYLTKNYQAGIEFFTKEIATGEKATQDAYLRRSNIYKYTGKYELAIAGYKSYLELMPELNAYWKSAIYENISSSYLNYGKYTEAITYARKSLQLNPKNDAALADRGSAFYYLENYFTALEDFNAAIAISPNTGWYYDWRGFIYTYGLKDYQRGIAEFDRAVKLGYSSARLYSDRGYAKQRLDLSWNISKSAVADYQQALKLARRDGNKELEQSLLNSIEDSQTETQRMFIGTAIALLLTGIGYSGLAALARRNEAKYLQQLTKQGLDPIDLI
jgi:tetratricopeptide (TPR) repeat protein